MSEQAYDLRPVWDALLDVYAEFAKLCDRHHLRYYVTGGTLLGAARHKGFIPWDDDFDVVMPRQDYRRFFDAVCNELPKCLRAYDFKTKKSTDDWHQMFGKVQVVDEQCVAQVVRESRLNLKQGVFIDVIPIDGMPKATIPFYFWALRRSIWRHRIKTKADVLAFERWLMKWDYDKSPAVDDYNTNGRRLKTRALSATSFGEPVMMPFDRIIVPCPRQWEKFLTLIYRDWRILPPPDKRKPSHQVADVSEIVG